MAAQTERCAGWHAVTAVLEHRPAAVRRLVLLAGRDDARAQSLLTLAADAGVCAETADRRVLDDLAPDIRHQGVVALVTPRQPGNVNDLETQLDALEAQGTAPFLLVLDQVQDPHNLGALLRTADAAGIHAVVVPADRAASLTPAARKAAAGAAEVVPLFQVTNLARTLKSLQSRGIWLHGLAGESDQPLFAADLTGPVALVLGAEGSGLRRRSRELCDALWHLPMVGTVESLNVSATGAVAIYEAVRQRGTLPRQAPGV